MTTLSRRHILQIIGGASIGAAISRTSGVFAAEPYRFVRIQNLVGQEADALLVEEIYKRAGVAMTIEPMPGLRALQMAASGERDGEASRVYAVGENFPSLFRMPTPVSFLRTVAFARKDSGVSISGREDLMNYNCVVVAGVLHTQAISEGVPNVQIAQSIDQMFQMLDAGHAELALTSPLDALLTLKQLGNENMELLEPDLNKQPLFHYVHESKSDVLDIISPLAAEMEASGELDALRAEIEARFLNA